jgi:hypothetical protein
MHFPITLPHPLARVARILEAVETARAGAAQTGAPQEPATRPVEPRQQRPVEYRYDLESLSLMWSETPQDQGRHDLDVMSLGDVEKKRPRREDSLSDLSLNRSFSDRPGKGQ